MGRVQFTNYDSAGDPSTRRLKIQVDGEQQLIDVASTGSALVPEHVETHLIESDRYAVEPYDSDDSDTS